MMSLTKKNLKPKIFFHCSLEDFESFEGLNICLAQSAEELCGW